MRKTFEERRGLRHKRIRKRLKGTGERPRMCVFLSNRHIYTQVIDDVSGRTICSASTLEKELAGAAEKSKAELAEMVGKLIGERTKEAGIEQIVFDRGGYKYGKRLASLADAARKSGLAF